MSITKYAQLVEDANSQRSRTLQIALEEHVNRDDLALWARELDIVNQHITVEKDLVVEAANAYHELGNLLVEKLNWPSDAIAVSPQGSTSTQTLVAAPTAEKFDIDAVCQIEIGRVHVNDPMAFFDEVGKARDHERGREKSLLAGALHRKALLYRLYPGGSVGDGSGERAQFHSL